MEVVLIALFVIAAVALFVSIPLRPGAKADERIEDPERAELEARKESKYREIRDAELDREQRKLSKEDWARADAEMRREAIEILREIDALPKRGTGEDPSL
jgi:hypothetical protein